MSSSGILLKNGIALIHDAKNHVVPTKTDILIENGKITKLALDITAPAGTRVIDCTDKVISPGFIDTHHHGWQTQLKGRHANEQLMEYMITGTNPKETCIKPSELNPHRKRPEYPIHSQRRLLRPTFRYARGHCCWHNHRCGPCTRHPLSRPRETRHRWHSLIRHSISVLLHAHHAHQAIQPPPVSPKSA
jgi:hypothetical protein